jgi:hypothetical protein
MIVMSWIGLILVLLGTGVMGWEHQIIVNSQIAKGEVVDLVASRGSKGSTNYAPKVHYVDAHGQPHTFKTGVSSSHPGVKVGDRVRVAYDLQNPEKARLLRFGYRFGPWYCLVGTGLLLLFLSYGFQYGNEWMEKIYLSPETSEQWDWRD